MPDERLAAEMLLKLRTESEATDNFPGVQKGNEEAPHNVVIDKKGKEKPVKVIPEGWFSELPVEGGWICCYAGCRKMKPWSKLRTALADK